MARILVVYGSSYGQTERIARRIRAELERQGHWVSLFKGDALPPDLVHSPYDAYVVAASVIGGKYQKYVQEFVRQAVGALNDRPSAFVAVSGTAANAPKVARKHAAEFLERTGWRPDMLEVFGGAMAFTRYGPVLRFVMKMISKKNGGPTDTTRDHELTDWAAVDGFALRLSRTLRVLTPLKSNSASARVGRPARELLLGGREVPF